MGYSTHFTGRFEFDRPLTAARVAYLKAFNGTRRMRRDASKTALRPDPLREAVGLPVGAEGGYFVGDDRRADDVTDYNEPPSGQPGLWCQWVPAEGGAGLGWDGGEKFYRYTEWLEYLVAHFFGPWGVVLSGEVDWQGDEPDDRGTIYVAGNGVEAVKDEIVKRKPKRPE